MRNFSQRILMFGIANKISFLAITTFCLLMMGVNAKAQIIAFDTNGLAGNETSFDSTITATNLNASTLSRGGGVTPSALGNAFSSTGVDSGTIADAIAANEFLQFTVSAQSGFRVSLTTLDVNIRRSGTGPTIFQFQYSLDNFATPGIDVGAPINFTSNATNGVAQPQIDLSTITALQNVASPTVITFRLFAAAASASTGTFAIGRLSGNDLAIGGTVAAVGGTTAAKVNVGGRVTDSKGRGIFGAIVTLTDGNGENFSAVTDNLGNYRFEQVEVGQILIFGVRAKRYFFTQPMQVVSLSDEILTIDFKGYSARVF